MEKLESLEIRVERLEEDSKESRSDMHELRETVKELTDEVKNASVSLMKIAENTTTMRELTDLYDKWKGFSWVVHKAGFWVAIFAAFAAGAVTVLLNHA